MGAFGLKSVVSTQSMKVLKQLISEESPRKSGTLELLKQLVKDDTYAKCHGCADATAFSKGLSKITTFLFLSDRRPRHRLAATFCDIWSWPDLNGVSVDK